jgi:hypothetical protein
MLVRRLCAAYAPYFGRWDKDWALGGVPECGMVPAHPFGNDLQTTIVKARFDLRAVQKACRVLSLMLGL